MVCSVGPKPLSKSGQTWPVWAPIGRNLVSAGVEPSQMVQVTHNQHIIWRGRAGPPKADVLSFRPFWSPKKVSVQPTNTHTAHEKESYLFQLKPEAC